MECICLVISAITLLLFLLYLFGCLWSGLVKIRYIQDGFDVYEGKEEEDYSKYLDLHGNELVKISYKVPLKTIRIFDVIYNADINTFQKSSPTIIKEFTNVNANEPIFIKTDIREGIPVLMVEYERFDYMMGSFLIGYNGKSGGVYASRNELKFKLRTILYYMTR